VLRVGQAAGVAKARILHAEPLRLAIHHLRKVLLVTGNRLRQCHAGVVARLDDHALEQVVDRDLRAHLDEHLRTAGLPGFLRDRHGLIDLQRTLPDGGKAQVGGHQLGQRSRLQALLGRLRGEGLTGCDIDQQPGPGSQRRRRRQFLGDGRKRQTEDQQKERAKLGHGVVREKAAIIATPSQPSVRLL